MLTEVEVLVYFLWYEIRNIDRRTSLDTYTYHEAALETSIRVNQPLHRGRG